MLNVFRREEKYPLNLQEALQFSHRFSLHLMPDDHTSEQGYLVRSLYFDTVDDKDFFYKFTEQNLRRKIRLRIYSPDDQYAKLELKQKENIYQRKRSILLSRADALALIEGNYAVLLQHEEPLAAELFVILSTECYRAKSIVEYRRRAFMARENHIRLTFDWHICATESSLDLFHPQLPLYPVFDADKAIFEVKYDRFMLEYISEAISMINRRSISTSKYCLSRSIGYPLHI